VNFHAIVLAAGSGKRMGIKEKKQFLVVAEKCIFIHALRALAGVRDIKKVVLVYNEEDYSRYKIIIEKEGLKDRVDLVAGGEQRQHSVIKGLEFLMKSYEEGDGVLIHDGARPLVAPSDVTSLMDALKEGTKGATLAYKINDTIKEVDDKGFIKKNVPRDTLWGIMTPQGFDLKTIYESHKALPEGVIVTDDTQLLIEKGHAVKIVEGSKRNIKLTTSEDLKIIEMFFSSKALKIESPRYV
jgi:2-C-methyl-D-erythritol 4-phosphate cytidylyltransferase